MQRPKPREFLRSVLEDVEGLPEGLAERLEASADLPSAERTEAMIRLLEEAAE